MAAVSDVAEFILARHGEMSTMKLQKLVYYSQAWSLVWDEEALFDDDIEAWANGPVVRSLFEMHRGKFAVSPGDFPPGNAENLAPEQRETVGIVVDTYGPKSPQWLSDLTHAEAPWQEARNKAALADGERGNAVISKESLLEYYSSLPRS